MPEVIAAALVTAWVVVMLFVAYRAGQQNGTCCRGRWGHDSPMVPAPKLPGLHIRQDTLGKTRTSNPGPEVVFRSRALDEGR